MLPALLSMILPSGGIQYQVQQVAEDQDAQVWEQLTTAGTKPSRTSEGTAVLSPVLHPANHQEDTAGHRVNIPARQLRVTAIPRAG